MASQNNRRLRQWVVNLAGILVAALVAMSPTLAKAQVPTGSITGVVQDAQGLPVEGVTVTLTNQETNATFTSVTASAGGYQFEHIDYGVYKVSASKAGFKVGE